MKINFSQFFTSGHGLNAKNGIRTQSIKDSLLIDHDLAERGAKQASTTRRDPGRLNVDVASVERPSALDV